MITGKHYEITAKNLLSHEWMGLKVKIADSSDPQRKNFEGIVLDETQNTLVLENLKEKKVFPKKECVFEFNLNGEKVLVEGKSVMKRPEDRLKDF